MMLMVEDEPSSHGIENVRPVLVLDDNRIAYAHQFHTLRLKTEGMHQKIIR